MPNESPEISVLLPARDAAPFLASTLRDLAAQREVHFEVVAVDDGSRDGTGEMLEAAARRDSRFRALRSHGAGAAAALNLALRSSRGALVAQMEADDRCPPDRLHSLRAALDEHPEWQGVVSQAGLFGRKAPGMRRYLDWQNQLLTPDELQRARFVEIPAMHQTGLYRRALFDDLEGFRDDRRWPLDIDFWMRLFEAGAQVGKLPRVLYWWRQHSKQSTRTSDRHRLESLQRCKAHFFVRGPGRGLQLQLLAPGKTLRTWSDLLSEEGARVQSHDWRPGELTPGRAAGAVRLFAFGMETARRKVVKTVSDFDRERDWFVG